MVNLSITCLILLTIHLLNNWLTPNPDGLLLSAMDWGALAGGVGSLVQGITNLFTTNKTNKTQLQLGRETNEMNYKINQENNAFNRALAVDMFNMENDYNNPVRQMSRLKAAGINPYVAAGEVGNVEGRADTIPAQNPIPMQNPAANFHVPQLEIAQPMAQLASAFAAITQGKKNQAETETENKTRDAVLKQLQNQAELTGYQARNQLFQNTMNQLYQEKRIRKELRNLDASWAKLQQEMTESEAKTELSHFQTLLTEIEWKTKDEQLKAMLPWLGKMAAQEYENKVKEGREIDSRIQSNHAQAQAAMASAAASYAAAKESNSRTETENALRKLRVTAQKLANGIAAAQTYEEFVSAKFAVLNAYKDLENKGLINENAAAELKDKLIDLTWKDRQKVYEHFGNIPIFTALKYMK